MKRYETVIVLIPEMDESETRAFVEKISEVITDGGGIVEKVDNWGKRQLAYPISKKVEGIYLCLVYQSDGERVKELERLLRVNEKVLRYLTVKAVEKRQRRTKSVSQPSVATTE